MKILCLHKHSGSAAIAGEIVLQPMTADSCEIRFLSGIGRQEMTLEEITKQLEKNGRTEEEQIRIIRKSRAQLLDEIHGKQQLLDRLDYMLYQMKEGGK